jgi:hypothetical protein
MNATQKDYGFILLKLEDGPIFDRVIKNIETIASHKPYDQVCIFNSSNDRIQTHTVPVLHLNQSKFFFGNLFLFDIKSAIITQSYPNIYKRYLYVTNVPWEQNLVGDYKEWKNVFDVDNLEIIAQNQHLADIYEICWKKPILVAEDFTYEQIKNILE